MTVYPKEFRMYATAKAVKAAFVSDVNSSLPGDCDNCGGVGTFSIFIATKGPFNSPVAPYGEETSHWHERGWWIGKTFSGTCPVCNGSGKNPDLIQGRYTYRPGIEREMAGAFDRVPALVHPITGEVLE